MDHVPGLSGWKYAGKTGVVEGKHNYEVRVGTFVYTIMAPQKHNPLRQYTLIVYTPHRPLETVGTTLSTAAQAVELAKKHYASESKENPARLPIGKWKSAQVRRIPGGRFQVRID